MRCPRCQDEYEPDVQRCVHCGTELAPEGTPPPPAPPDTRLGRFHPAVAELLQTTLVERGIAHETVTEADGVILLVPEEHRHDVRAELMTSWPEVLDRLPDERADEVRGLDGQQPGWLDSPRGAWVDRAGRMVVETEEDDTGRGRTQGPVVAASGVLLLVLSWYADLGTAVVALGAGLLIVGLLVPR